MAARNLVNLKDVSKSYSSRTILDRVTLGIEAGDRIGVVGRNGDGKSTLLRIIGGIEQPDSGQATIGGEVTLSILGQGEYLQATNQLRDELVGDREEHEWAGDPRIREVMDGLLGGVKAQRFRHGLDTPVAQLSGGERRRIDLAKTLLTSPELLILDEPTNHLDVEAIEWLARHLTSREGALLVVTHDRWFLDAVVEETWEVVDTGVNQYEGGYAAWVLARAERERQAAASEQRRRALIRKELAWLRRGPPARTTKPKFRVDAANELIADVPPPRNQVELLKFAAARLGNRVIDAINISFGFDPQHPLIAKQTWRLGPGDRIGLVGVNGAGKSTLIKLLAGHLEPMTGSVKVGLTVRIGELSQDAVELPEQRTVIEALEDVKLVATLSEGQEITASMLCDRFGFSGARARTPVGNLSGGERRRLQIMRIFMAEPNVLLLDEPTNDLDIETLNALEDLLDSWPGTLVIVSHDRYFTERVTDNVYGLMGDGMIRHLPRGIDQYLEIVHTPPAADEGEWARDKSQLSPGAAAHARQKEEKRLAKEVKRLDRELAKANEREAELHEAMAENSTEFEKLRDLQQELAEVTGERDRLEAEWLEASEQLEALLDE